MAERPTTERPEAPEPAEPEAGAASSDLRDLELVVRSRIPIVAVASREEERVVGLFTRIAERLGVPAYRWSVAGGLRGLGGASSFARAHTRPAEVLAHIVSGAGPGIYLLLDFHPYLGDPLHVRLLREIAQGAEAAGKTLVLTGPELDVPSELRDHAARFELSLPDAEELRSLVEEEAQAWGRRHARRVQATTDALDALTRNLLGLTRADARRLARGAIYDDGVIDEADLPDVTAGKYRLLDQGGVLSFEMDTTRLADVAGLANLKRWLEMRREIFLGHEPIAGLDPPKGVLLLGVQGGGKSLAAKAVAGAWGVPLLRLDFGTLYNKFYGETERNLRESLQTAGAMSPCVLWIDEIEKGLATDNDSGGPSRRILGTLLTWMGERRSKVFLVATANDIESLPPELLRKGRFDEIFFVDLPDAEVRCRILEIHLAKRGIEPAGLDLASLTEASDGFTGAELEQAVVAALYAARARGGTVDTEAVSAEIAGTRPLSVLMAERIGHLRAWAAERTVPA